MKRKILGGIAVLVIAAITVWNMSVALKTGSWLSDAALANIEAYAEGEGSGQKKCKQEYDTKNEMLFIFRYSCLFL